MSDYATKAELKLIKGRVNKIVDASVEASEQAPRLTVEEYGAIKRAVESASLTRRDIDTLHNLMARALR